MVQVRSVQPFPLQFLVNLPSIDYVRARKQAVIFGLVERGDYERSCLFVKLVNLGQFSGCELA